MKRQIVFCALLLSISGCGWLRTDGGKATTKIANRTINDIEIKMGMDTGLVSSNCAAIDPKAYIVKQAGGNTFSTLTFIADCIKVKSECNGIEPVNAQILCNSIADSVLKIGIDNLADDNYKPLKT